MPPKNLPVRPTPPPASTMPEVVDPKWLLKAGAAALGVAMIFAYSATCALFYKAQWQLVLKPEHTDSHKPGDYGMTAETVSFGPSDSGEPQLRGWAIPAASPSAPWVLMCPSGEGSAGDSLARAHSFHELGYRVFLFDYRGFGSSLGKHPTQAFMQEDSEDALDYLKKRPGFSLSEILVYGTGAGASIATRLAASNPGIPALLLEQPDGDFAARARLDPRAKPVAFGLLFHEDFPLAAPLQTLKTPKLIVSLNTASPAPALKQAADPKMLLELPSANDPGFDTGLKRFLDMYAPHPTETLVPGAP